MILVMKVRLLNVIVIARRYALAVDFPVASSNIRSNSSMDNLSTGLIFALVFLESDCFRLLLGFFAGFGLGFGLGPGTELRIFIVIRDFAILGLVRSNPCSILVAFSTLAMQGGRR
jgi:hypothetical protein